MLQAPVILVSAAVMALLLNTISHAWTSPNLKLRQRCLFVFPLCIVNGYLFAALTLALLRMELLLPQALRTTVSAWMFLTGLVILLIGIYYAAFASEIAEIQETLKRHGTRWSHWFLPHHPHPNRFRVIAVVLLVGGLFLCSNSSF